MVRVLSARRISDRLKEADFNVQRVSGASNGSAITIRVGMDDRDELSRVMAALAPGYEVDISTHHSGYDVRLQEMG